MKLWRILSAWCVLAVSIGCAHAWPVNTNSFVVQVGEQVKAEYSVPQGEPRVIEARFMIGTNAVVVTNMVADYLYLTDSGTNWYTAPCSVASGGYVRLSWGTAYDNGSLRYKGWFRVLNGSNPIYRVQLSLKMIETPGFTPNATALTVAPIDFGQLTWTNEPWWGTNDFTAADTGRWTAAWSWGNHGTNGYVKTNMLDGTTLVVNPDGTISAVSAAAPDLVARQAIAVETQRAITAEGVLSNQIVSATQNIVLVESDPVSSTSKTDIVTFNTHSNLSLADGAHGGESLWNSSSNLVLLHAGSSHSNVSGGGFQAGSGSIADSSGGAIGYSSFAHRGGAMGAIATANDGGAIGLNAKTSDGFAGGKEAFATTDGTIDGSGIDAIQLGIGGNTVPGSMNVYGFQLLGADGVIPLVRLPMPIVTNNGTFTVLTGGELGVNTAVVSYLYNSITDDSGTVYPAGYATVNREYGDIRYLQTGDALNGTNITDNTVNSNKFDAATRALLGSGGTGGGSQTPATSNWDLVGYSLTGANNVTATNNITAAKFWLGTNVYWYFNGTGVVEVIP